MYPRCAANVIQHLFYCFGPFPNFSFIDEGSITLRVQHDKSLRSVSVVVTDTGSGIPLDFRDKLFHTAGLTTTNCHYTSGAGLGLCISKCVTDGLGGTIGECIGVCNDF